MKTALLFSAALCGASALWAQESQQPNVPVVKVIPGGDPAQDFRQCRRMLVGPGVNQPDPYPGYRGFVGWQSPIVLQDGTMLVGFSSGYWHASPPTAYFAENPTAMEEWKKIGMPTDVDAPRGGARKSSAPPMVARPGLDPRFCWTHLGTTELPISANCPVARFSAVSSHTPARPARISLAIRPRPLSPGSSGPSTTA